MGTITKFLSLLLLIVFSAQAGLPPTTIRGQADTSKSVNFNTVVPNKLATQISGGFLIENGNKNLLANGSFEHSTINTGWSSSVSAGSLSTNTQMTSAGTYIDGAQALQISKSGASGTFTFYQDTTLVAYAGRQAQISAWIAASGNLNDELVQLCPRINGTVQTTCINVKSGTGMQLYKVPFIMGGTSNGLQLQTVSALTSVDVNIDDARLEILTDLSQVPLVGGWTSYTPATTQGFGTTSPSSNQCQYRVNGSNLDIRCKFTIGTVAASEAQIGLPSGFTSSSTISTLEAVGYAYRDTSGSGVVTALIEPSKTYITFGYVNNSSTTPLGKLNGSTISGTGNLLSIMASVPIQGLNATVNTYVDRCATDIQCANEFSAKVSSAGVVSDENLDWINGNAVVSDTSLYTFTFNTGIFTSTPNCFAQFKSATNTSERVVNLDSSLSNSTTLVLRVVSSATNVKIAESFNVRCEKATADYKARREIIGTFKDIPKTPNQQTKTCYAHYGGASATLASPTSCTTGTCVEVYDSCGVVSAPSFTGTGVYENLTFANGTWANSSPVTCNCSAFLETTSNKRECEPFFITSDNTWSTNSSGGLVLNISSHSQSGTADNSYFQIQCSGVSP